MRTSSANAVCCENNNVGTCDLHLRFLFDS